MIIAGPADSEMRGFGVKLKRISIAMFSSGGGLCPMACLGPMPVLSFSLILSLHVCYGAETVQFQIADDPPSS